MNILGSYSRIVSVICQMLSVQEFGNLHLFSVQCSWFFLFLFDQQTPKVLHIEHTHKHMSMTIPKCEKIDCQALILGLSVFIYLKSISSLLFLLNFILKSILNTCISLTLWNQLPYKPVRISLACALGLIVRV